jgi:hypothetical protein
MLRKLGPDGEVGSLDTERRQHERGGEDNGPDPHNSALIGSARQDAPACGTRQRVRGAILVVRSVRLSRKRRDTVGEFDRS